MLMQEELLFTEADLRDHVYAPVACRYCKRRIEIADKVAAMRRLTYGISPWEEASGEH